MEPTKLDEDLLSQAERAEPALAGPARVVSTRRDASGRTVYAVSARRLVPVDEADPALRGVSIAVPAECELEVGASGVARVSLARPDDEMLREARAFTRSLIANGAVRGLRAAGGRARRGPGGGETHEVRTDRAGRKVIERRGFDMTGRAR